MVNYSLDYQRLNSTSCGAGASTTISIPDQPDKLLESIAFNMHSATVTAVAHTGVNNYTLLSQGLPLVQITQAATAYFEFKYPIPVKDLSVLVWSNAATYVTVTLGLRNGPKGLYIRNKGA